MISLLFSNFIYLLTIFTHISIDRRLSMTFWRADFRPSVAAARRFSVPLFSRSIFFGAVRAAFLRSFTMRRASSYCSGLRLLPRTSPFGIDRFFGARAWNLRRFASFGLCCRSRSKGARGLLGARRVYFLGLAAARASSVFQNVAGDAVDARQRCDLSLLDTFDGRSTLQVRVALILDQTRSSAAVPFCNRRSTK